MFILESNVQFYLNYIKIYFSVMDTWSIPPKNGNFLDMDSVSLLLIAASIFICFLESII